MISRSNGENTSSTFRPASAASRSVRGGMDQPDAELAAGPQQPCIDKSAAVVDIDRLRNAARGQRRLQRARAAHGVLGEPEPVTHRKPRVIIQKREEVGLAATDPRAVQRVADPAFVRCRGLEPAEHHRLATGGEWASPRSVETSWASPRSVETSPQ